MPIEDLWRDLLFSLKTLRRSPGFTLVVSLTLGVALGISAIAFSIVNSVLLTPLPYEQSDRLVRVHGIVHGWKDQDLTPEEYENWACQAHSFETVSGSISSSAVLTGGEFPLGVSAAEVTSNYFEVLRLKPVMGRMFQESDRNSAVLSFRLWKSQFGGNPNIVGRNLYLDGKPVVVIGVAPENFRFSGYQGDEGDDLWIPRDFNNTQHRGSREVVAVGRLRQGITFHQAQAELDLITRRSGPPFGPSIANGIWLVSLYESTVGFGRPYFMVLSGAVVLVLLTACANIANLLLARASRRREEMAIRVSLGAPRWRLIRQMLTESALLCLLGGVVGIVLASFFERAVIAFAPPILPRVHEIAFDPMTFGFTLAAALVTGMLSGIAPALLATRRNTTAALKNAGASLPFAGRSGWLGKGLVSAQIALALILLIATGILLRTYVGMLHVPHGFDGSGVLLVNPRMPEHRATDKPQLDRFHEAIINRIKSIPGVECAAIANIGGGTIERLQTDGSSGSVLCHIVNTTPDYFRALRIRMMSGRSIEEFDDANAPHVAVLSETAATALFAATNPHGRRIRRDIRYQTVKGGTEPEIQIIGVVNDVQFFAFGGKPGPVIYLPLLQSRDSYEAHTMVIRTHGGSAGLIPEMRKAIQMVDQGAALGEIETLDGYVDKQYAVPRFNLSIIGIFGAVAFGLATIGIYGTIAYAVSQRTHEIGIRMALGAQRGHVLRLVIRQGLWIVLIGEVIGLVGSVWLMRLAAHFMYGLRETDGLTFIVVSVSWAFIAIVASYIPARRATLIDPLLALRCE